MTAPPTRQKVLRPVSSMRISPTVIGAVMSAVIAGSVLTSAQPAYAPVFLAVLLFVICVCATWSRLSPVALSPMFFFAAYLALLALLGITLTNVLVGAGGTGGVDVALDQQIAVQTAAAMLVGASIALVAAACVRPQNRQTSEASLAAFGDLPRYAGWFLVFGTLELTALVGYLGLDQLLERSTRLVGRGGSALEAVISMAAIASVAVVGIAFFSRRGFARMYAAVLLVAFFGYFVSMGTRRLALVPLLLLMAYVISKRGKVSLPTVLIVGLVALLLLPLPLHFRGQWPHGLLPYLASLSTFEISPSVLATSFNNFLAGFKITAMTGFLQPSIPLQAFWVSVNPMSGDSAGWYDISTSLRINRYTPYSAIGELINYGPIFFVSSFVALGLILGSVQRINDRLFGDPAGRFVAIIALGLTFIFVIQSTQYNLRSDLRYVYLAVGSQLVWLFFVRIRGHLARRRMPKLR